MLISKENSVLDKQTAGVQEFSKADLRRENKTMKKKNVSNRSSSSSNNYDDDQPGYGRGF